MATTKSERAYWELRRAVVTGELAEGTILEEHDLLERLGVGRTPLREAMKRLAHDEFVIWYPHHSATVRTTTIAELTQLYEARHIFEIPAARIAAERVTPSELETLDDLCDSFDEAVQAGDTYAVAERDYDIHLAIAKASHNRFLIDAVAHLNCGSLRLWFHSYRRLGTERINDDHRRAVNALRLHDAETAATVGREHIEFSHQRQLKLHGLAHLAEHHQLQGSA
ncbi:MAG: GntR family transcriptional regulator [Acidimicrobiia bacterium]